MVPAPLCLWHLEALLGEFGYQVLRDLVLAEHLHRHCALQVERSAAKAAAAAARAAVDVVLAAAIAAVAVVEAVAVEV